MVKAKEVVKEMRRMRLFGVNIAKEVTRFIIFGKEIFLEVDINDQLQLSAAAPPLTTSYSKLTTAPIPSTPVGGFSDSNKAAAAVSLPAKNDGRVTRKKKIRFVTRQKPQAVPLPQLSLQVRTTIGNLGGTEPVFLTTKKVEVADVGQRWGRLFVPKDGVDGILKALTMAEKQTLGIIGGKIEKRKSNSNNNRVEGKMEVTVVDGEGNMYDMDFKKWPSLGKLVFAKQWYKFAKDYGLEAGNSIQLWCFRDGGSRLCFAIVKNEG